MHTQSRAISDVEFSYDDMLKASEVRLVARQLPPVDYDDPATGPSQLLWDANFNTTFGPLHKDNQERAPIIERAPGSPVVMWLPSAEDIALSKMSSVSETNGAHGNAGELYPSLNRGRDSSSAFGFPGRSSLLQAAELFDRNAITDKIPT